MNKTKRFLVVCGGMTGLFLIGSLMEHPGSQAKGAYSTPVQVMNTSSAPAIGADAEKLARIPYQSSYRTTVCTGVTNCFFSFTAAPSGYRLVVENLSGLFEINNAATAPPTGLLEGSSFLNVFAFTAANGQIFNGTIMSGINIPVKMVFDTTEGNPVAFVYGNYPSITGLPSTMTLSGYLENCSVTGCPT